VTLADTSPSHQTLAFDPNRAALYSFGSMINVFTASSGHLGANFIVMRNGVLIEVDSDSSGRPGR
jgi:hypothetical protein